MRECNNLPKKQGLYDPTFEHDACGVGFVCNIKGKRSNKIVRQGLEVLERLSHRGATGADPKTGDGAGILIQMPHNFFTAILDGTNINLPAAGEYGTGLVFLPVDSAQRNRCKELFSRVIKEEGQVLLGWRKVPVDNSCIGHTARSSQPEIEQPFIKKSGKFLDELAFERKLYIIRKRIENQVRSSKIRQKSFFYITNLSSRTFSYKGLLMSEQLKSFFPDLSDERITSAISLVHSRYSTNTFPTWDLAQPFRFIAHNGEINTLRGNINWMRARQGLLKSKLFGQKLKQIFPVIVPGGSDSATLDNVFEFLMLSGRDLAHVMLMLIPSAWEQNSLLAKGLRDFYKYHACIMEPWDGPAAIAFSDGKRVGAVLDRNGLRPARYIITRDDTVVMASEVGVLDIPAEDILSSGRLNPGKIFFIDTEQGRIVDDKQIKEDISKKSEFCSWLKDNMLELDDLPSVKGKKPDKTDTAVLLKAFGYSREDLKFIIKPMFENSQEPVGSMGNDTPHAVLSKRNQLLYSYFKQLFAQVTNPAIDPIREELVMSLDTYLGPEGNLLDESASNCHKLKANRPVLTDEELSKIRFIKTNGFKTKTISLLFKAADKQDFLRALKHICSESEKAIKDKYTFIILSDRGVNKEYTALPALLATGAVHHHLVKKALRNQISIIVESAEPREVHHFALLFGYGADCVNPYLAYRALDYIINEEKIKTDSKSATGHYIKAVDKGILKILSKMGISTLQSYRGAQIFEAFGINDKVIDRCFAGTASRIGGVDFEQIRRECVLRHGDAFIPQRSVNSNLDAGGIYQYKKDGEFHLWNPDSISALQDAVWNNDYKKYKIFAELINDQRSNPATLRGCLKFKAAHPLPIEQVEPAEAIVRRFVTGAMSFGSISKQAHETMAIAMNRIGAKSNSGEGGEDPERFSPLPNGDLRRSAIKQVASGRFGVTTNYLINADELQIKIAQGAKPGEGGQLPGHKVSPIIAKTRYTTAGVTLISPPPHHDIYSIEDLAQLIFDLKNTNPRARISVKLVSEMGVGTIAAGVAKGHADMILISGGDGGTGASPLSSIKHAGLPWELGISETHQTLVLNDLRSRVRLQADGQMRTGRDVAVACLLGAEEFGFATAALITLGCVMLRHCHLNNCSVGIATQEEILCNRFHGKPEYITIYLKFVAEELREIMASLGLRTINEMVGRTEFLEINKDILPWKATGLDYSRILYKPKTAKREDVYCSIVQNHGLDNILDKKLIELSDKALKNKQNVNIELTINNTNRTTGAMLSGEVCRLHGEEALPEDTIYCKFRGVAGQSFGAFLAKGITFELEGMSNDYVGKGISGGKIIIYPDRKARYVPEENIIIGNTTFYGAINGEAYINGIAGERFCIRNSGLLAVVEGVGDHACEYMTGGKVVVLGKTGRNFAAGMSGGVAYVYDGRNNFRNRCNMEMVELEALDKEDKENLHMLLSNHYRYTKSNKARIILDDFDIQAKKFIKVMPIEYKKILEHKKLEKKMELAEVSDG